MLPETRNLLNVASPLAACPCSTNSGIDELMYQSKTARQTQTNIPDAIISQNAKRKTRPIGSPTKNTIIKTPNVKMNTEGKPTSHPSLPFNAKLKHANATQKPATHFNRYERENRNAFFSVLMRYAWEETLIRDTGHWQVKFLRSP